MNSRSRARSIAFRASSAAISLILAAMVGVLSWQAIRRPASKPLATTTSMTETVSVARPTPIDRLVRVAKPARAKSPDREPASVAASHLNEEACWNPSNYVCTRKIFRPTTPSGDWWATECLEFQPQDRRICLDVQVFGYDTSGACELPDTRPEDRAPGGEYNHEEFLCYHQYFRSDEELRTSSEGSEFASALRGAVRSCLQAAGGST